MEFHYNWCKVKKLIVQIQIFDKKNDFTYNINKRNTLPVTII